MTQKRTLAAVIGATAAAVVLAFTGAQEGTRNTPYRDTGNVWTVCKGQTGVPMHYYTNAQCDTMFANTLVGLATQIEGNTPGFGAMSDGVKSATLDFAYNVGFAAYTRSSYRTLLMRGDVQAACDQLLRWKYVDGKDCSVKSNNCLGVWNRRQAERSMCRGNTVQ